MSEILRRGCTEYRELEDMRAKLILTGEDTEKVRKLDALLKQDYLKGGERAKALNYLGKL